MAIMFIALYIISIVLAAAIAKKREGNVIYWTALAVVIGPLVLPLLPFVGRAKTRNNATR